MTERTTRPFGTSIPEMRQYILRYGVRLSSKPPYALLGKYRSKDIGPIYGILAAASNEFHAHVLRREFAKHGEVNVMRTEHHPTGSVEVNLAAYEKRMREIHARRERQAKEQSEE